MTVTFVAVSGPLLVTMTVKSTASPSPGTLTDVSLVTDRSAVAGASTVASSLSLVTSASNWSTVATVAVLVTAAVVTTRAVIVSVASASDGTVPTVHVPLPLS